MSGYSPTLQVEKGDLESTAEGLQGAVLVSKSDRFSVTTTKIF
jgi:hypothetical protein